MKKELITIKGTKHGLVFYFNHQNSSFQEIYDSLLGKFEEAKGFFNQAKYSIYPEHSFDREQIKAIEKIFLDHGMCQVDANKNNTKNASVSKCLKNTEFEVYYGADNAVLISKSLRSGQKIYVHGHAIIRGDVNPGAEVRATGSIIILGTCRGIAYGGVEGDNQAFVLALKLRPTQIAIGNKISRAPEREEKTDYPEIAIVKDRRIVVEPYQSFKGKFLNL